MAKNRIQKEVILRDLEAKFGQAKSVIFARFNGFTVVDNEALRNKLRAEGGELYVAKKTLISKVMKDRGIEGFNSKGVDGQLAAIFGYQDEVLPAKLLAEVVKTSEGKIDFAGGYLEGRVIDAKQAVALSKVPSREELYAKLVGSLNAPVSGFVNVLAGNLRNLVYVLKAIEEKKA